jgi:hypothetical protein
MLTARWPSNFAFSQIAALSIQDGAIRWCLNFNTLCMPGDRHSVPRGRWRPSRQILSVRLQLLRMKGKQNLWDIEVLENCPVFSETIH